MNPFVLFFWVVVISVVVIAFLITRKQTSIPKPGMVNKQISNKTLWIIAGLLFLVLFGFVLWFISGIHF
jgi:multisubunit Na+/H+ antiporter MnhB subunit